MIVKDYYDIALEGSESFLEIYDHPFLTLIRRYTEIEISDTDFFTEARQVSDLKDLGALASGQKLEQEALIYEVVKRSGANPYANMVTIGRVDNCDITIPWAGVSKFHAYIGAKPGDPEQFLLCDSGSRNGTKLRGEPLEPNKRFALKSKDIIELGSDAIFRFYLAMDFWKVVMHTFRTTIDPPAI